MGRRILRPDAGRVAYDIGRVIDAVRLPWLYRPVRILRPADLVVLELRHSNLELSVSEAGGPDDAGAWLVPPEDRDGFIMMTFQPQNVAEQAFFETAAGFDTNEGPNPENTGTAEWQAKKSVGFPVASRIAGPSVLAFRVPKGSPPIPYTTAGLLEACMRLELNVVPAATPPEPPPRFRPPWVEEIEDILLDRNLWRRMPVGAALHKARLYRWQDNSDAALVVPAGGMEPIGGGPGVVDVTAAGSLKRRLADAVVDDFIGVVLDRLDEFLKPRLRAPDEDETAIELPFRMYLSPNVHGAFVHSIEPKQAAGSQRIELWHTRLATRVEDEVVEDDPRLRTVRAIWARAAQQETGDPAAKDQFGKNYKTNRPEDDINEPFLTSLTAKDRFDIVHLSANATIAGYHPRAIDVDRLMLTSLGSWIDARGAWDLDHPDDLDQTFSVEEWRHRGTFGRDHYVRVVYKGFLFPFGHRASLIKVTERKFYEGQLAGRNVTGNPAMLFQRMFIVVRTPVVDYQEALTLGGKRMDLAFPFQRVTIKTLVTPNLDPASGDSDFKGKQRSLFCPKVMGDDFRFDLIAEDVGDSKVEFEMPLYFIRSDVMGDTALLQELMQQYPQGSSEIPEGRSEAPAHGQRVALAPPAKRGDTTFEIDDMRFGAVPRPGHEPPFHPVLDQARIVVPAVKTFTGSTAPAAVSFEDAYLGHGLPKLLADGSFEDHVNRGQVFLKLASSAAMDFSSAGDKAGALLQPTIDIKGLSRLMGPVGGDLTQMSQGTFNPLSFFPDGAKLFGVIGLKDLIAQVGLDDDLANLDLVPRFVTEAFSAIESIVAEIERLRAQLEDLIDAAEATAADLSATKTEAEQLVDGFGDDLDAIASALAALLDGVTDGDKDALQNALQGFRDRLEDADTFVSSLPAEIPLQIRQALQQTLGAFFRDLGKGVAETQKLIDMVAAIAEAIHLPEELKLKFEWKPQLEQWPESFPLFLPSRGSAPASLVISAELQAKTNLKPDPRFYVAARMRDFTLNLLGDARFLELRFKALEFTASSEAKPDVNVEFDDIAFVGPLSFVEALRDLIPLDGFSDPPALQVTEEGISASFSLALPDVAFGVFSLQNLSLGAGFSVPFLLNPLSVRFNFCERHEPFLLTVSMFGGGGFFALTLDPSGVQILEAAFEFGASLSLDFGVASGGITVMGGIYYKVESDAAQLTGYLRMVGEVDVLGLISACIELYMELQYQLSGPNEGKAVGRATLTIEIEIAFFSTSVTISCERKFAGSNGDPTFAELMAPQDDWEPWTEYCAAFADS